MNNILSGMPLGELTDLLMPLPRFRAAQIFKWIASGICRFEDMGNLPAALRQELAGRFFLRPDAAAQQFPGEDGTVKLAIRFADGAGIEAVLLPGSSRRKTAPSGYTACLSTQAGCPAGCVFCKTGSLGFLRNLSSAEMVEQFLQLHKAAEERLPPQAPPIRPIASIVVMGMGEPLLNLAELRRALEVITSPAGIHFSKRRITVSTCGIAAGIVDLADNGPAVRLALSLTAADESLRRRLMPFSRGHGLAEIREACGYFQKKGGGRITLEVVLLGGINTSGEDAAGIAKFAAGLDAAVNLIPWNPVPGLEFEGKPLRPPSAAEVNGFKGRLEAMGLQVTCRFRRGRSVMGACGQLGQLNKNG